MILEICIRNMKIDDYEQVYTLWSETFGVGLNDIDDSEEGIAKYLKRNPNTCYVAEKTNHIIGAVLSGHDGRRGYISHLAVAKEEQHKGIGSKLLNAVMAALKKEGIQKVALVVFADNEKGNLFWEKQGFTVRKDLIYRNKFI